MRNLLTILLSALCFGCAAQFPPPFIHNYWDTNASPNSPIMNVAKEVTNNIRSDQGVFRQLSTTAAGPNNAMVAYGNGVTPFVVDEFTGTNLLATFINVVNSRQVNISSNADIAIGAGIYSGDGSGLTNLPSSGGSGTVIWNTNAAGTLATNTFSKANISFNLGGGFFATSFNGSGSGLTAVSVPDSALQPDVVILSAGVYPAGDGHLITTLNASQLTSGTVALAALTNAPHVLFSQYNFSNNIGTGETTTFTNTLSAGTLGQAGQSLRIDIAAVNNSGAGVTRTINVYLGSTKIYTSGGNNQAGSVTTDAHITIMRGGTATTGIIAGYQTDSGNNVKGAPTQSTENFANALGLGVTLTGNTGTGDITNRMTTVVWYPAGQ